jgi:hypothetical protein
MVIGMGATSLGAWALAAQVPVLFWMVSPFGWIPTGLFGQALGTARVWLAGVVVLLLAFYAVSVLWRLTDNFRDRSFAR